MESKEKIYNMIRNKKHRVTPQKKVILDVFFEHTDKMLSVYDVKRLIPDHVNIDITTIYRNIQKYVELGILESMVDSQGQSRYTICEKSHHHYFICTNCGKIIKFPCENPSWTAYAEESHFQEAYHKVEVYGKCADCKKK